MYNIWRSIPGARRVFTDHVPKGVRERMLTFVETGNPLCGNHLYMLIMFLYIEPVRKTATYLPIAVCSSAQEANIQGFLTMLREECAHIEVVFLALPYNDLDSFKLEKGLYSGLILCHSIHNRRFAITNVLNALYDVFLPHARDVLGEKNVSVVVHDFQWPLRAAGSRNLPSSTGDHVKIKEAHMEAFRIKQPTTFQCSDLVMISGRLEDNVVEMDEEDKQSLINFVNTRATTIVEVEECQIAEGNIHSESLYKFLRTCLGNIIKTYLVVVSGDVLLDLSQRSEIDFPGRVLFLLKLKLYLIRALKSKSIGSVTPVVRVVRVVKIPFRFCILAAAFVGCVLAQSHGAFLISIDTFLDSLLQTRSLSLLDLSAIN